MNTIIGLVCVCVAPFAGAYLGKRLFEKQWLSNRLRVFLASLVLLAGCTWLAFSYPWVAFIFAVVGFFAIREGRTYPVDYGNYGGYADGPYGYGYRARVADGATWGDVHQRDRNVIPWSQKSDLREMQEGAMGSIGSPYGSRFDRHPPVIRRSRPGHARLIVDNGHFPPKGSSAKRGKLKSVK